MATREVSPWAVGWSAFAGVIMIMMGVWWIIAGLVAVVNEDFYVVTQEWILQFNVTTWGWIHLVLGVVILLAGFGVFSGSTWSRAVGTVIAVFSGIAAFAWLPYYPIWASFFILTSVLVVWALTTYRASAPVS